MFMAFNFLLFIYTFITNRKNLHLINPLLRIAEYAAHLSKNKWDDTAIASLAMFIRHETKGLDESSVLSIAKMISDKTRGSLKDISVEIIGNESVKVKTKTSFVKYNYKQGTFRFKKDFKK